MTVQLEAIIIEEGSRYSDPLDRTGPRCAAEYPGIGICHRRYDHVEVDEWHHAITDVTDNVHNAQHWRWRDADGG